jgi:hypothetical protein
MTNEQPNNNPPQTPSSSSSSSIVLPYEGALLKAFERLTSEIFIFLLAYVILIIGLTFLDATMTDTLRNLLYIIPILGVVAYTWLRQRNIVRDAKEHGVDLKEGVRVSVGKASGKADIGGFTASGGPVDGGPVHSIDVSVKRAEDQARIRGMEYIQANTTQPSVDEGYLANLFEKLNDINRRHLIDQAQKLLTKQG